MSKRPCQKNICIVCFESISDTIGNVSTPCGHTYCTSCFAQHMRMDNRCAYCRTELAPPLPKKKEPLTADRRNDLAHLVMESIHSSGGIPYLISNIKNRIRHSIAAQQIRMTRSTTAIMRVLFNEITDTSFDFDLWMIVTSAIDITSNFYDDVEEVEDEDEVEDDERTVLYDSEPNL
jgi:hypothetical protein